MRNRSTNNSNDLTRNRISIPHHLTDSQKIKLWNTQFPTLAERASQFQDMLQYSVNISEIMSRQTIALNSAFRAGQADKTKTIREGIQAWKKVKAFMRSTCDKVLDAYKKNLEFFEDNTFERHKAMVFATKGFEKEIDQAYRNLSKVFKSLYAQGMSDSDFESPGQKKRNAQILSAYNTLLAMQRSSHF